VAHRRDNHGYVVALPAGVGHTTGAAKDARDIGNRGAAKFLDNYSHMSGFIGLFSKFA